MIIEMKETSGSRYALIFKKGQFTLETTVCPNISKTWRLTPKTTEMNN